MNPLDRRLARDLLTIGAVAFNAEEPFSWASGIRSPIYCDNRLTISYPQVRRAITSGFADVLAEHRYEPSVVAGTATAGIPHAAWLSERIDLPMVYVRASAKTHGKGRRIEGRMEAGASVVLVEDLVSTGMSSLEAAGALQQAGARVLAVLAVFSYELPQAATAFQRAGVPLHNLTTLDAVLDEAGALGQIDAATRRVLAAWKEDPVGWSPVARV